MPQSPFPHRRPSQPQRVQPAPPRPTVRPAPPRPAPRPATQPVKLIGQPPAKTSPPEPPTRNKEYNHGAPEGWHMAKAAHPKLAAAEQPRPLTLYAIIGTWFEADVMEAAVKNCFANGCSKVFIVDNDSPDDTCYEAEQAGAEIARVYKTEYYEEYLRLRIMNEVMQQITERDKIPELWWLSLDADEFPCGPGGVSVKHYLEHLHPDYNVVGANSFDLFPTKPPYYEPGLHPADTMDMGMMRPGGYRTFCQLSHWKHPLLRSRNGVYEMAQSRGCHDFFLSQGSTVRPCEPESMIWLFHAPYRRKETSFSRLEALCGKNNALGGNHRSKGDDILLGSNGATKRFRSMEAVYRGDWGNVEIPHCQAWGKNLIGVALYPWQRRMNLTTFPRWYAPPQAEAPARLGLPLLGETA